MVIFETDKKKELINELLKHNCIDTTNVKYEEIYPWLQFRTTLSDEEINNRKSWTYCHYEIEKQKDGTFTFAFDIETRYIANNLKALKFAMFIDEGLNFIEHKEWCHRHKFTFKIFNEFNAKQMIDEICDLLPKICPKVNAAYLLSHK